MNMEVQMKLNQTRELTLPNSINNEDRTVEIAFMSETPVKVEINGKVFNEILLTTPTNVDLSRLNNGAALLWNHQFSEHIGKVESARIDGDRVGRAIVRFSTVGLGDEKWRMVQEGILTKVSCGYQVKDYYFEGNNLYVTSVLITELSMVSVPADDTVGIGRSLNKEVETNNMDVNSMEDEIKSEVELEQEETVQEVQEENVEVQPEETEAQSDEVQEMERHLDEAKRKLENDIKVRELQKQINSVEAQRAELVDAERKAEIQSIAKVFNVDCTEALNSNVSIDEFKRNLSTSTEEKQKNNVKDNNMSKSVIEAMVRSIKGDKEALNNFEQGQRGYVVQPNEMVRANATTTTTTAAGTIEQQYASDFIRPLLAETILGKMGIEVISGVTGREFTIPRLTSVTGESNFRPYAEGEAFEESAANFDSIVMKPTPFAGSIRVTKSLLLSSPTAADYVQTVLIEKTRNGLEQWIVDTAASKASQVVTSESGAISEVDILAVVEKLAKANVRIRDCYAVVSPSMYVKLRQTPFLSNTAGIALTDGFAAGQAYLMDEIPLMVSTFVEDDAILVGLWNAVAVASWVGSTIDVDDTTYRSSLGIVFRNYHFMDVVVKHPEAFVQLKLAA